jgi:hypothetical protein
MASISVFTVKRLPMESVGPPPSGLAEGGGSGDALAEVCVTVSSGGLANAEARGGEGSGGGRGGPRPQATERRRRTTGAGFIQNHVAFANEFGKGSLQLIEECL